MFLLSRARIQKYICTHAHMHACTHTCMHAHTHTHTQACMHTHHMHACMLACSFTHTGTCAHQPDDLGNSKGNYRVLWTTLLLGVSACGSAGFSSFSFFLMFDCCPVGGSEMARHYQGGALPGSAEAQTHHRIQGLLPQGTHSMGK